ncbi:MAG: ParB/RepB/Spo0J family partition protein [Lachnospiraceae bacterium]|nr:ParB/RepB/Spo0J family partition protein [Lachnospiraceae bacterium]
MNDKLVMIDISEIYPNKDNPRKDIGDIKELTKSIKKNGLMQNLTVVPGHWENELAYTNGYTLLIGHRRYAAAKAAGLTEVPCRIISGMDKKEQVSTMLEENMQRADLTAFEQAEGFQMVMDLGYTEKDLVTKTGFSETTIKRRLNIAKLDKELLKEKNEDEAFQLSLTDLYKLEQIKSIDKRNEVLSKAKTANDIDWLVRSTVDEEKRENRYEAFKVVLKEAGIEEAPEDIQRNYWGKYDYVTFYLNEEHTKDEVLAKVTDDSMYFRSYNHVYIIKPKEKTEDEDIDAMIDEDEDYERITANFGLMKQIVESCLTRLRRLVEEIIDGHINDVKPDKELYEKILGLSIYFPLEISEQRMITYFADNYYYNIEEEQRENFRQKIRTMPIHHRILFPLASKADIFYDIADYNNHYDDKCATKLKGIFDIFSLWGWQLTEEEEKLLDGTSELFEKDEEKNEEEK